MTVLLLGGAAAIIALLAMTGKSSAAPSTGGGAEPAGLPPLSGGASNPANGPITTSSNGKWKMQEVRREGDRSFVDVFARAGAFGPTPEFQVLRFVQTGGPSNRVLVRSVAGVSRAVVDEALKEFNIRVEESIVPDNVVTSPGLPTSVAHPQLSPEMRQKIAAVLKALGVDAAGKITGTPTKEAVQAATSLAGELDKLGFPETAAAVRQFAAAAAKQIPSPVAQIPIPGVSPEIVEKINRAIQFERDPAKLRQLKGALLTLPKSQQRDDLVALLDATILQIEAAQAAAATLAQVESIVTSPGQPTSTTPTLAPQTREYVVKLGDSPWKIAVAFTGDGNRWRELAKANPQAATKDGMKLWTGRVLKLPTSWASGPIPSSPAIIPTTPVPQPLPLPLSPAQSLARKLAVHLHDVQRRLGMPRAKGREDFSTVKAFQSSVGQTADGKAGPGTLTAVAKQGVTNLPLVMYWPKSGSRARLARYKADLTLLANQLEATGNLSGAAELRASIAREKGQAGVA